jgi:hypothetical protein
MLNHDVPPIPAWAGMTKSARWDSGIMDLFWYVICHNEMRTQLRYGFRRLSNLWKKLRISIYL